MSKGFVYSRRKDLPVFFKHCEKTRESVCCGIIGVVTGPGHVRTKLLIHNLPALPESAFLFGASKSAAKGPRHHAHASLAVLSLTTPCVNFF